MRDFAGEPQIPHAKNISGVFIFTTTSGIKVVRVEALRKSGQRVEVGKAKLGSAWLQAWEDARKWLNI